MTPIQKAMCAVIRESGSDLHNALYRCAQDSVWLGWDENGFILTVDNHTLTQQEYEEWEKQLK